MNFWLGVHQPQWVARTTVPLFLSRNRLVDYRTLPRALGIWAQDSGGFTEISRFGGYRFSVKQYVQETRRFAQEVGQFQWAAPMDWMCEPYVLNKSGLTVIEHQRRTTENYQELRALAPELPWIAVLQGWTPESYLDHAAQYAEAGVALARLPLVGLGSVCRRQHTTLLDTTITQLAQVGLRLHVFGFKFHGLRRVGHALASADSMAWSFAARRKPAPCPWGKTGHKNCANCLPYALAWRRRLLIALREKGYL